MSLPSPRCHHCGIRPALTPGWLNHRCSHCAEAGHTDGPCLVCQQQWLEMLARVLPKDTSLS